MMDKTVVTLGPLFHDGIEYEQEPIELQKIVRILFEEDGATVLLQNGSTLQIFLLSHGEGLQVAQLWAEYLEAAEAEQGSN